MTERTLAIRTFTRITIALAATAGLVGATLSARASSAATPQWTDLKDAPAPVSNPMKGFMPWAPKDGGAPGTVANALPYTLEWAPFPVNTVVTGRDTYDFYDNKRISFSPNYNDPKVQEKLLRFVAALGDRYDGDPRIGFITAGLYGFWGNEHTYPYSGYINHQNPKAINWMPSNEFRARLVEAWDEALTTPSSRTATPPLPRRLTAWATTMIPSATRPWRAPAGTSSPS